MQIGTIEVPNAQDHIAEAPYQVERHLKRLQVHKDKSMVMVHGLYKEPT